MNHRKWAWIMVLVPLATFLAACGPDGSATGY